MDANNLATVLAPSILRCHCEKSDIVRLLEKEVESGQLSFQKKDAEIKCLLIRILIENAENIGILTLYEKVMSPDMYDNLLPEDHNCMIYGNGNKNLWRVNNKKKNGRQAESSNLKYVLTPSRGSQRKVIANQKRLNMKSNDSSIVVSETNDKKQLLLENVVIPVGTKETTHQIVEEMPRNETKFPEDEIMKMGGKPETIMPEDKKNSAVIRSSSSKAVVTAREPIDHKPSRSESDSCVANKSRRKVRSAATTTAISKTNDSSPKKKLRRNTGRVSNKNRPPLIEVGVRKTRSAAAAQTSERVVAEKIPKIEENVVFAEPAHPSSLATIDENGDFEHSDKIKELLQSMTENPTDLSPKHTGIRNSRLITNQQNQSNGGHGVRPSVAYILKTRKGFVRENKALFEGLAKDLREELDSSAVADTSRPHNGVNTPSITELYTLTTPKKKTSTVGKLSPPTSSRRRPGITTPRVSINNLRRSNGGTGSARKSLKRITNQNASTRKLSSRKYPSSPLAPPYNMKNRSKLSVLPDLRVTHIHHGVPGRLPFVRATGL
uniref:Rho-GAP domain-containing protein n=1 Tax=Romanomermis culicivorax TaxID=13658 RepID=A0A915I0I1_ROMCU